MKVILNTNTDPYFNLASEEFLLANEKDDLFMLWRNSPSVIIGKNQNAWAEVNVQFTEKNNIKVVRRLTGGGAVFHDLGNINFTFITKNQQNGAIDFERFTIPVIEALNNVGINAALSGRNDITANSSKISGNAQCLYRQADGFENILHHGTLLYNSDMTNLTGSLNVRSEKIQSKGISSVRSRVENIFSLLPLPDDEKMSVDEFLNYLQITFAEKYNVPVSTLTNEEINGISKLRDEKYSQWSWNFGQSKKYQKTCGKKFEFGWIEIMFTVDGGIICDFKIFGDFFGFGDVSEIENSILNKRYEVNEISSALENINVSNIISGCEVNDIVTLLFE